MRLVILESPYVGKTPEETQANVDYARKCVRDCLLRGEAPIASHLLYTQPGILSDDVPEERGWGMRAGLAWSAVAEAHVVYTDRGISAGMRAGMSRAQKAGKPVEERTLKGSALGAATNPSKNKEPTPEELRDLLLAAGIDVSLQELTKEVEGPRDALDIAKWARDVVARQKGFDGPRPYLPNFVARHTPLPKGGKAGDKKADPKP